MPAFELRRATPDDAADIARIYIDSWNEGFGHLLGHRRATDARRDRWVTDLADPVLRWTVAVIDGRVVGFCGTRASRDDATLGELDSIGVDPRMWQRGVGRLLMEDALDHLADEFDAAIVWTVVGYTRGDAFYRATGWRPLGRERADGTECAYGRRLDDRRG